MRQVTRDKIKFLSELSNDLLPIVVVVFVVVGLGGTVVLGLVRLGEWVFTGN